MKRWLPWRAVASSLAAAGLGLMIWMGFSMALLHEQGGGMVLLRHVQLHGLALACLLVAGGLVALLRGPAGLAGIRWNRLAMCLYVLTLALGLVLAVLLGRKPYQPMGMAPAAAMLTLAALATLVACGLSESAAGRAGWRRQMVVPGVLCYALLAGAALLFALLAVEWPAQGMLPTLAPSLMMLAALMAGVKLIYWFENGGLRAPVAGLPPGETVRVRLVVLLLLALLPLILALALFAWPSLAPRLGWCLIAISVLAGGCLERGLQYLEARQP